MIRFSAGGHVALGTTLHYAHPFGRRESCGPSSSSLRRLWRKPLAPPDFLVLVYPVVTMGYPEGCVLPSRNYLLGSTPDPRLVEFYSLGGTLASLDLAHPNPNP